VKRAEISARLLRYSFLPDAVRVKQDGTVQVEREYFYRFGLSPEGLQASVVRAFPEAVDVEAGDRWAPYPRRSFMWVRFRIPEAGPKS
jgi:hypothetical protein